jgi:hypothetical protein
MASSCMLSSASVFATGSVSAWGSGLEDVVSEFDAPFPKPGPRTGSAFRGIFNGLSVGWSLKGFAISARPTARLNGSGGLVSIGDGFVLDRLARSRSARGALFLELLCGVVTET